ncbi:unnamed protein product [Candidula unifasciata]|uniref:Uncharacterized protein n=1 Tax=Candidula unifasciata TaxID=100452 RepID=A0A8S3Z437_9EUPU|nr:unnamed protein product [Candidula unifasciata]
MVVYTCCCLNICIFADKIDGKSESDIFKACPLGSSCEAVELIDQGFQFVHKCLVQRLKDGDWTVYVCIVCGMRTHAVNVHVKLVAVSSAMKRGREVIEQMKNNPDYSQVFGLLLSPLDSRLKDIGGFLPQGYEALQKQLGDLQDVLSRYLKQEEEAMESRIRNYEEEQRNNFMKLKEMAQKEKAKLISVLFHNSDGTRTIPTQDRGSTRLHAPVSHSKSTSDYESGKSNFVGNGRKNMKMRDSSPDVFAMDELELEEADEGTLGAAYARRSARTIQTWSSLGGSEQKTWTQRMKLAQWQDDTSLMSTSVPISMPAHARSVRVKSHLDDSFEESAEFDDIPRNMQALSESIQERDRYIFGDRPRQRVHTGDFTQVNWH